MIRFLADAWWEALLRPFAMAAPNGWVYIEIVAPDFRFLFAIGLAVVTLIFLLRRRVTANVVRNAAAMFALTTFSFVVWMATTGNGRYFMPYLVAIGPLCVGLVYTWKCSRSMKAIVVALLTGVQGFALYQNNPWEPFDSWESVPWIESPYFSIDFDSRDIDPTATYITVSTQSMSLIAPQLPPSARWVNLSVFNGSDVVQKGGIYEPFRTILKSSKSLKLIQRSAPREMLPGTNQPNQKAISAINDYLQPHKLAVRVPTDCNLLHSKSLLYTTLVASDEGPAEATQIKSKTGFWICSLDYPVEGPDMSVGTVDEAALLAVKVLEKMEKLCRRYFPPGQDLVGNHPAGHARSYPTSDSSLIVTRHGDLYIQYARALNPQKISSVSEFLSPGYSINCNSFKGRAGLPWEREI
jgi:hypothetical protein